MAVLQLACRLMSVFLWGGMLLPLHGHAEPWVVDLKSQRCASALPLERSVCVSKIAQRDETRVDRRNDQCRFLDKASGRVLGSRSYRQCGAYYTRNVAIACAPGPGNPVGCGLVDRKGDVILPTIYQDVRVSQDSSIVSIKLSDKWGFFDLDARKVLLAPQFARVNDFREDLAYVEGAGDEDNDQGWFINREGDRLAVVPPGVQSVGQFHEGLARALVAGRWGFLNSRAQWVIPAQFVDATDFDRARAVVKVARKPEQWAVIDLQGRGVIFLEGAPHRMLSWNGEGLELEVGCAADEGVHPTCEKRCLTVAGPLNQAPACALIKGAEN